MVNWKCELCDFSFGMPINPSNVKPVFVRDNRGVWHVYCCVSHAKLAGMDDNPVVEGAKVLNPGPKAYPQQTATPAQVASGVLPSGDVVEPNITTKLGVVDQMEKGAKEDLAALSVWRDELAKDILFWNEALATYNRSVERAQHSVADVAKLKERVVSGEL